MIRGKGDKGSEGGKGTESATVLEGLEGCESRIHDSRYRIFHILSTTIMVLVLIRWARPFEWILRKSLKRKE
jgi:hypothetical protein